LRPNRSQACSTPSLRATMMRPGRVGDHAPVIKYRGEYGDENSGSATPWFPKAKPSVRYSAQRVASVPSDPTLTPDTQRAAINGNIQSS
jgi:hypothetical protein